VSPAPLYTPVLDSEWHGPLAPAPPLAPHQPVVLDLLHALSSPPEGVCEQLTPPGFCLPLTGDVVPASEPELGSPECPTVGSQGHWSGVCKPCAFLYTRGCANGVGCSFCHLCDQGEKKRRAKDKRSAARILKHTGF